MAFIPTDSLTPDRLSRRSILLLEFAVMGVYLFFVPFLSQFSSGRAAHDLFEALSRGVYEVGHIALIFFVVWVADGSLRLLGVRRPKWGEDFLVGLLAVFVMLIATLPLYATFPRQHAATHKSTYDASIQFSFFVVALLGASRQTLIVVYAFARLRELLGNDYSAMALSALLYGALSVATAPLTVLITSLYALVFVLVIWKTGRIWPLLLLPVASFVISTFVLLFSGGH